jgi:5'-3' exoribonuclease 2
MGVPGFFLWLMKTYNKKYKFISDNIDIKIDYLLIDTNCLIHPMCFKILHDNKLCNNIFLLENKMINAILEYMEYIINFVKPNIIYIAIDGVAPLAKIKQQRSRRFKSISDKKIFDIIKKKHNIPINYFWNNSAITPGTIFMKKLHNKILEWAKKYNIIYSSCYTPSEGEHKLLQFIRNNNQNDKTYVIYGLDADLIFLALSTDIDKIFLLREQNQINSHDNSVILNYVSINIMKNCILETFKYNLLKEDTTFNINLLSKTNLINDFIFMCYFLGNDFLPHIPSLNIYNEGIIYLISIYSKTMIYILNQNSLDKNNKIFYLLKTITNKYKKKINNNFLQIFISNLALQEDQILKKEYDIKNHKKYKHNFENEYEKEMYKIENLQFKINDPIMLGLDDLNECRKRYYKYYWDISDDKELEEFSEKLVIHYLIGIKWVTDYYFDTCTSWNWYYPYDHPPFISDINKYLININLNKIKFELGAPIEPFMQLLTVLPPQSAYLIPNSLKKLILNTDSNLYYLYPYEFNQDFINKFKYWMGIPLLPPIDIELLKKEYNNIKLNYEEKKLNMNIDIFKFNI